MQDKTDLLRKEEKLSTLSEVIGYEKTPCYHKLRNVC
jgi:hypothetical protein